MEKTVIIPQYVCCDRIIVEHENGTIARVDFEGGCDGNGKAIARLLAGMTMKKAAEILAGVDCEGKGTSCADQLVQGLKREVLEKGHTTP